MKITIVAGRAHLKHTEGGDFRQATYRAVRQGLKSAESVLLEPWYSFVLEVPSEQVGRAMSDIGQMNGSFEGPEAENKQGMVRLTGTAPASEMRDYQREVWAYTKGRGRITLTLKVMSLAIMQKKLSKKLDMTVRETWIILPVLYFVHMVRVSLSNGMKFRNICISRRTFGRKTGYRTR